MDNTKLTFDQAMTRLEEIAACLEDSKTSLEDAMKLYEEGMKLSSFCNEKLNKAELKIKVQGGEK